MARNFYWRGCRNIFIHSLILAVVLPFMMHDSFPYPYPEILARSPPPPFPIKISSKLGWLYVPGTVPVSTYPPNVIINSTPSLSKRPNLVS